MIDTGVVPVAEAAAPQAFRLLAAVLATASLVAGAEGCVGVLTRSLAFLFYFTLTSSGALMTPVL